MGVVVGGIPVMPQWNGNEMLSKGVRPWVPIVMTMMMKMMISCTQLSISLKKTGEGMYVLSDQWVTRALPSPLQELAKLEFPI